MDRGVPISRLDDAPLEVHLWDAGTSKGHSRLTFLCRIQLKISEELVPCDRASYLRNGRASFGLEMAATVLASRVHEDRFDLDRKVNLFGTM